VSNNNKEHSAMVSVDADTSYLLWTNSSIQSDW